MNITIDDVLGIEKPRVEVTRCMVGICHMQVCAVADATDEEILDACNRENPSGTARGWCSVVRATGTVQSPVPCVETDERIHFLVGC